MNDVYIIAPLRTAIGNFMGSLSEIHPAKLAAIVIREVLKKTGLEPEQVNEVILGNVLGAGMGQNLARQAAVAAGIPVDRTAFTVNMVCGSGLRSVALAAQAVRAGDADIMVAGGTENMSLAPYILPGARTGYRMGNAEIVDYMVRDGLWDIFNEYHMGITAENLAEKYGISRDDQDAFAAQSQNRAEAAIAAGKFAAEIVAYPVPQRKGDPRLFDTDEYVRPGTTAEQLHKLKPAFRKDGTVTAGNASGINDGAACCVVAGGKTLASLKGPGLPAPAVRIVSWAAAGVDPSIMGIGPVGAVRAALKKAQWKLEEVDLIEANEAFAAQALAVGRELKWDTQRVNVNGGAIALGHPIGASGARILTTLVHEMGRRKAGRGLAALCIGGGMGIAMCVESL